MPWKFASKIVSAARHWCNQRSSQSSSNMIRSGRLSEFYNAGIDQTTLRPSVDVEYALIKDGREVSKQIEDWRGASTAGDRLTLARLIDSRGLAPGDYAVEVRAQDRVSGAALVQQAKFTIVK